MPTGSQVEFDLDGVRARLQRWSGEADRIRLAADATRLGALPSSRTVEAAEAMYGDLVALLADTDAALETLPAAAHRDFAPLLRTQSVAMNLLEALGSSLDVLERLGTRPMHDPVRIEHGKAFLEAAE